MKEFNLERAIAGDPLITRDGREAVFIAYVPEAIAEQKLIARIGMGVRTMYSEGMTSLNQDYASDLFMAPVKRTLWQNLYTSGKGIYWTGGVFKSEKDASAYQKVEQDRDFVKTFSFEVEE